MCNCTGNFAKMIESMIFRKLLKTLEASEPCFAVNENPFSPFHRPIARPARVNTHHLELALPVENHCLWPTMLIKHRHSRIAFFSSL